MDFTYSGYKDLIQKIRNNDFEIIKYTETGQYEKEVILRHDVDVSLEKALEFAYFEAELNIQSTYYILLSSNLYNIMSKKSTECIKKIYEFGHSIGLHFDETKYQKSIGKVYNPSIIKSCIIKEKDIMETVFDGIPVESVSMHIPSQDTLKANLTFESGFINSYSEEYFKNYKYVSDSEMRWREDVDDIVCSGKYKKLHILTHPIWYDFYNIDKQEKVLNYLKTKKQNTFNEVSIIVPGIDKKIMLDDF